jgi:hypothetical protein
MNNNKIKPVFKFDKEVTQIPFSQSRCLLTISVGQEVHEGDKFAATVDLVREHFAACTMLIDDTLQRHTMVLNHSATADDFMDISRREGDQWLLRNQQHYHNLPNLKILHWDYWLQHPQYLIISKQIQELLAQDTAYQDAFNLTITIFLQRYCQRLSAEILAQFNHARAHQLCFDYLLEECIAMCLWPELNCHFEVYPSERNAAMSYTHQKLVLPQYPNLLHPVAIKFKQRKQFKPQVFNCYARSDAGIQGIESEVVVPAGCRDPVDRDVKASRPSVMDPGIHAGTTNLPE